MKNYLKCYVLIACLICPLLFSEVNNRGSRKGKNNYQSNDNSAPNAGSSYSYNYRENKKQNVQYSYQSGNSYESRRRNDRKAEKRDYQRSGLESSVGESESTYTYYKNNNGYGYGNGNGYGYGYSNAYNDNLTMSRSTGYLICLIVGALIIYGSVLFIFYTEKKRITIKNLVSYLKSRNKAPIISQITPELYNQLVIFKGVLQCVPINSIQCLGLPESTIKVTIIKEEFKKEETREDNGKTVNVKVQYKWGNSIELSNILSEIRISNLKLNDPDSIKSLDIPEYIASPSINEVNEYISINNCLNTPIRSAFDGFYYTNQDVSHPQIGDQRIKIFYKKIEFNQTCYYLGKFNGQIFQPYETEIYLPSINPCLCCCSSSDKCYNLSKFSINLFSYEDYIKEMQKDNTVVMRIIGFFIHLVGYCFIIYPISNLIGFIPFIGDYIILGIFFISLFCCLVSFLFLLSVAWLSARPLLSLILFGIIIILLGLGMNHKVNNPQHNKRNNANIWNVKDLLKNGLINLINRL